MSSFPDSKAPAALLGLFLVLGLVGLGWLLGQSALRFKEYERTVTAKGLSERDVPADVVLWPIQITAAANELGEIYAKLEADVPVKCGGIHASMLRPILRRQQGPKSGSVMSVASAGEIDPLMSTQ